LIFKFNRCINNRLLSEHSLTPNPVEFHGVERVAAGFQGLNPGLAAGLAIRHFAVFLVGGHVYAEILDSAGDIPHLSPGESAAVAIICAIAIQCDRSLAGNHNLGESATRGPEPTDPVGHLGLVAGSGKQRCMGKK
jgi:hypothetical protein